MPTVTLIPTQTLVNPTTTLSQVEYKTSTQSWLGPVTSHLMRWRCFILVDNETLFYTKQSSFNVKKYGVICLILMFIRIWLNEQMFLMGFINILKSFVSNILNESVSLKNLGFESLLANINIRIHNNYSMSPSWIWSDKITNERVARVGYNHFISNKGEWNNCFSKFSKPRLPPIFISTILQSVRKENLAHYFPYDVKLRLLAHSRSFLANQKARNAIVGAENLLNVFRCFVFLVWYWYYVSHQVKRKC